MKEIFTQITAKRTRFHDRSTPNLSRLFGTCDIRTARKSSWRVELGLSLKSFIGLTLLLCINFLLLNGASAQTTETFESFSMGATSFTSGGTPFTLNPSSGFKVDVYSGYGYLSSNNYIDNLTSNTNPCQIKSTSTFSVKSLYLYPSTYAGGDYNQTAGVNVTFTGKLASVTKFTYSPPASDFASASWSNATNRGFSLVNFATPGYDNIAIDELEVTLGGSTIYFAIDNFTWGTAVVNNAPTDIALSASSVNENVAGNTSVGTLSTTDPDAGNTFTYSLVSGTGSTDNASFNISGSSLRITSSPDYETKSSYSVRVRTTDQGSLYYEKAFTININDLNEAPTDISLSASSINENVAGNSTVGTLSSTDPDAANTFTYTLVAGTGSTDNASFNISGSSLRITSSPDYETKSSYSVRVRTTDQGSLYYEKAFTITINNVNETPTDISLSASSINENVVANSTIGTLSSTDPDAGNTFTYTLVAGTGSTDNASFNISGSSLRITNSPDFEIKSSYSVRVRTTDQGTLYYEKAFTITINDLNESPTDISLSASSINENVVANSTVGTLSSTDQDAVNTFTYTLVAGTGSTDNASFNISGSSLRITGSPDFETKSSYSVRVRTTDQGTLYYEKAFTITINDLNEAPTDISLSASSINENVIANSTVGTLSSTDQDAANTFIYSLVAGTGSTDNASFNISGSSLRITNSPDFETKSSYSVRIRTTDQGTLFYEKAFTITISNVNETPTDLALSVASINENVVANSTVGALSTTDPDAGNTFTYTLVAGTGSTDNASFNISGSSLRITSSPDYETKNSFSVRVRSTDQGSLWFEKVFIVTINDLNEAPSDITLSASSINENVVANSTVGTLSSTDQDAGNTFTYTLVAGAGSTDNASFNISGSSLRITNSPDFETKSSYSVRIRTTDQGSLTYEKVFTITINNVNETPTDIALSATSINENVVANSAVGTLSTTDPDAGNTFTYTLEAGTGDTDNASFNISGSSLRITNSPDFETKNSYSVRIRTTDQGSLNFEKTFTITINNVNETPTDINLSANSIDENVAGNSTVGSLTSTDVDAGNTFTYTLVTGTGDTDNASFNISGGNLRITNSPDFETKNSYSVRVRTTDQGSLTYEKAFTITINDLNEAPTNISLSANTIDENVAANSMIGTLSTTDQDAGNTFTYTLVAGAGSTDNASFSISDNELHIISSPDYETKSSYLVRVRSTDQGSLYFEKSYAISINNVNEAPVVTASQSFSINENSTVGTVVGTVSATDPDAGTTFSNWTITSNVNPNGNGTDAFAINSTTGQITVADAGDLDREANSSFTIKVTVSDGTITSAEESVTINLNDVNDVVPVITASQELYVTEQSPNGTTVGTVVATDGDVTATTFQNWTITAGNGGGYFAINSSTGVITVVDNTGLNSNINQSFTLTLTVSDGVNTSQSQTVSIIVSAVNDENPVVTPNQSFAIDENSANSTIVGTVLATDPDYGTNFQNWTITAGNTDNAFAINSSSGQITVNNSTTLDYETVTSFSLTIQVSDGLHTASGVVTVNLNNLNDNAPTINGGTFALDENSSNGTSVCTISANDPDGTLNALTFSLVSTKVPSPFAVNLNTGAVTVNNSTLLDYETIHSYSITIRVSDGTHSADGVFTINLNNLNDNSPVVTDAAFAIDENSANGTAVGTVAATDADGILNTLTYSIKSGNTNNAFAINSATGAITVGNVQALDFETTPIFNLTVSVSDGVHSTNGTITINLNNVVETGIDDNREFSFNVYPNPAVGKVNISLNNPKSNSYNIEIIRIDGVKIYQSNENTLFGVKTIDLAGIPSGIYFVRVYNDKTILTDKLIVQ
ncbi:MAG: T9SS type A sorting domain-containing protein [Bacteroidales bacterium]|nr:T9SS type A sorting domain-containing protein [Bacteroidales bacterium]